MEIPNEAFAAKSKDLLKGINYFMLYAQHGVNHPLLAVMWKSIVGHMVSKKCPLCYLASQKNGLKRRISAFKFNF